MNLIRLKGFLFFLIVFFCANGAIFAQSKTASIGGHVSDASQAVIQNARVVITPGDLTTTSDSLGDFVVAGLAPRSYTVTVTSVGFEPLVQTVTVAAGQTVPLNAVLQVASGSEQVVVSAGGGQNMLQAINEEITSPNIVNVMPETEILALPNANVADAIGRLPGVTVQRDEGEAVYVQVRGLDPRLTNTTIDGVTIPSPESNVRQVILATIPADMVQSIELNKTLSANQDADGIGGSVNMVTKMAGEAPTFNGISTLGYSPIENGRYMGLAGFTLGKRFGASKRWGVIMRAPATITTAAASTTSSQLRTSTLTEPAAHPVLRQHRRCASIAINACAGAEPWARITRSAITPHWLHTSSSPTSRTGATSGPIRSKPTPSRSSSTPSVVPTS
jgi:hypothetical protein